MSSAPTLAVPIVFTKKTSDTQNFRHRNAIDLLASRTPHLAAHWVMTCRFLSFLWRFSIAFRMDFEPESRIATKNWNRHTEMQFLSRLHSSESQRHFTLVTSLPSCGTDLYEPHFLSKRLRACFQLTDWDFHFHVNSTHLREHNSPSARFWRTYMNHFTIFLPIQRMCRHDYATLCLHHSHHLRHKYQQLSSWLGLPNESTETRDNDDTDYTIINTRMTKLEDRWRFFVHPPPTSEITKNG